MSELDEKINKAEEIYNRIVFLERGINNDSHHNELKLIENYNSIIGTIKIYYELLEISVGPNISLSNKILNYYYNQGKRILREIETKIENISALSEKELLSRHGVELHDNKKEKQYIAPGTMDPITLEVISNGETIAHLIDESNRQIRFPPPPFIYDENNYGIRKLILSSKELKNPITRKKIQEIHLYTAEVSDLKESDKESDKEGGRRKTKNKRRKTIKRRKNSKKTKR
jgi:hypothetical protein